MKISVQECMRLEGKRPIQQTYHLPHLTKRNEHLVHMEQAELVAEGEMQSGLFIVQGEIHGRYTLSCARCLAETPVDFVRPFEEKFNVQATVTPEPEDELEEIHEVTENMIDLQPYVEEEIIVRIPLKPTCATREECQQNLPQEGKGWTIVTEEEQEEKVDPRLAELAKFYDSDHGSN